MIEKTMFLGKVLLFLLLQTQTTNSLFASIGVYPNHIKYGVNLPECGLRYVVHNISRHPKCFLNNPGNAIGTLVLPKIDKVNKVSDRIYNGREANDGDSPWTVKIDIWYSEKYTSRIYYEGSCTGSLITFEWVLTSAHCFVITDEFDEYYVRVYASTKNVRKFSARGQIYLHADYNHDENRTYINDIALLKLEEKYDQDMDNIYYHINTICLPNEEFPKEREKAIFSGWGIINMEGTEPAKLQITDVLVDICDFESQNFICARTFNTEGRPCEGDSGGPLFQLSDENIPRAFEIGVLEGAKEGLTNCSEGNGLAYWVPTKLHILWILDKIAKNTNELN